jgi:chromosome segregation ATPase
LEEKEKALEEIDSEVTIEKRQIWRIGSEIHSKRSKLNRLKKDLRKKVSRCDQLSMELELARSKKLHTGSMAMTADDRSKEMQQLLDREESLFNTVQFELDKLREKKLSKEKVLRDILNNEEANNLRLQGLGLEIKNISKKNKLAKAELAKKEDIAIANNYTLSQIERELARLRGTQSEVNRAKLKESIDQCKLELENRLSDKRNLDHLVHKMSSDVRKVRRDIVAIDLQQDKIRTSLEKVTVINESCDKERQKLEERLEALLMEQKMMKLTERKAKEDLEELNNDILELKKQDLEVNERLLEQRADAESKREVYAAQLRCLKDELVNFFFA